VEASLAVLDRFMMALNAGDEPALLATLHFPHYRLAGDGIQVWDRPGSYLGDFRARAGAGWHYSQWDFRNVIAAGPAKVHLDVQIHPLPRRQLGDRVVSLIVDRHQIWWTLGRGGAVELRGLAANHRLRMHIGANELSGSLLQMGFSGKTAIVTGAPSGS
jgi:hypothetical protein